jgi:hypothetical protein
VTASGMVLIASSVTIWALWAMAPCSLVEVDRSFRVCTAYIIKRQYAPLKRRSIWWWR